VWLLQIDEISSCTVGLCGPLHGGYQDNILEDNILGQHLRLSSQHMLVVLARYKYVTPTPQVDMTVCEKNKSEKLPQLLVLSSLLMRVRVQLLTSGIRVILFCSINISCSSTSHASLGPQPTAGTPAVPTHPSSLAQTSSNSSEAASSPCSSPH
jgi:hypothetical protein